TPDGRSLVDLSGSGSRVAVQVWDLAARRNTGTFATPEATSLTISPDGRTLATDAYGAGAQLWDLATGRPTAELRPAYATDGWGPLAFSPDGRTLAHAQYRHTNYASAEGEFVVQLWDLASRTPAGVLVTGEGPSVPGAGSMVFALAYQPGGRL